MPLRILLLFFLVQNVYGQNYSWAYTVKGAYLPIRQTLLDPTSNIYILASGNEINHSGGTLQSAGAGDFIAKYNTNGIVEWKMDIGNDSVNYYVRQIRVNSLGELILGGSKNGNVCFKKYNSAGTLVWSAQFAIPQSLGTNLCAFTVDSDDNIIAAGNYCTSTCDYCSPPTELFICKINNNGSMVWSKNNVYGQGFIYVDDITTDENKNIIFCGSGSNLNFQGSGSQISLSPGGYLAKYSTTGEPQWAISTSQNLSKLFLACDGSDIYVAGGFQNQITLGGQNYNAAAQGSACMFKVGPAGNIQWTKTLGDVYACFSSIQINNADHTVWLSGGYSTQLNINTQSGSYTFNSAPYCGYNLDYYVLQADSAGSWQKINMVETVNGQMWGATSNIVNWKFAVGGCFWGQAIFTEINNNKDTICGPPGNVSYDGVLAFYGNSETLTKQNENILTLSKPIVYPNPSNDIINIEPGNDEEYDLEIYDEAGRVLLKYTHLTGTHSISTKNRFNAGVYFAHVKRKQSTVSVKIIVQ